MIKEISTGDTIRCLNCKKEIVITSETFKFNPMCEYIECPYCQRSYDVQTYHMHGEKVIK